MPRITFTKKTLDALPLPAEGKRATYTDAKAPGLELRVTPKGTKTFTCQRWIRADSRPERVTLGRYPAMTIEQARRYAHADVRAGTLLIREVGSPLDTHPLDGDSSCPRFIRSGKHIARPKRYLRDYGVDLENPDDLAAEVTRQARDGDGWVKLVGDWIDRDLGELAPLWSDEVLKAAIDAAHANGARVTAHVFSEDALPGLIRAGIDCIEHGTGLTEDTIDLMVQHGTALVPTLINIDNFPDIAAGAGKYPKYQQHMLALHQSCAQRIGAAREAGVPIYAGSDAGSAVAHGRIADEVEALKGIGMTPTDALGAACWDARRWLGRPTLEHGASADLVCFDDDPRSGPEVLANPALVMLRGKVF